MTADNATCCEPLDGVAALGDGVGPRPIPGPFPPDWWRCLRFGAVSGRYEGDRTAPTAGGRALDLRVDIDPRSANSPVMERVSGDFYKVFSIALPGRRPIKWRVYESSWIVDSPKVDWFRCRVEISGTVKFWKGVHPATTVAITIPWGTLTAAGPATVTFTASVGATTAYMCPRKSGCFRSMTLEADVCASVNTAPLLPAYNTHWHANRPADMPERTLTIEEAYNEAGICMTVNPDHTVIDDSAAGFDTWTPAELHDIMEVHFSQHPSGWPKWHLWGLLAGTFESSGVGGIMFDAAAAYGGAGDAPDRQGFAVFRNHSWFADLVNGAPANQDQAQAMRHYLYTWVHEAGHAFNLLHSWNKARPDALSWMNYDWKYDLRNGVDSFWSDFRLRFDDEELIHIRHGDRASVIMGGDPWASGGHAESPSCANDVAEGDVPIELLLRSKAQFDFMEPVAIELRLRNRLEDLPLTVDARLHPDFGGVIIYIRRPDGRTLEYAPILCKLGLPNLRTLEPSGHPVSGSDRYSEPVMLTYGAGGFYFDQPGEYLVRAVYQGAGDILIASNLHRIRVGIPVTKEEDNLAGDFFTYQVGMSLYLNGSRSPFLEKGMERLQEVAERSGPTALGSKVASVLAQSLSRPFYRVADYARPALTKAFEAEPERALGLTTDALAYYQTNAARDNNLAYHDLVRARAGLLVETGRDAAARAEVSALLENLRRRDVKQAVLGKIEDLLASI